MKNVKNTFKSFESNTDTANVRGLIGQGMKENSNPVINFGRHKR